MGVPFIVLAVRNSPLRAMLYWNSIAEQWYVLVLCSCATLESVSPRIVHYEPEVVQLTGLLRESVCPGPPEYMSIKMGDRPECIFILLLDTPIHVRNINPKDNIWNEPEDSVFTIQVAASRVDVQHVINKKVVVTGSLFHAITAHHRTEVIMMNNKITFIK